MEECIEGIAGAQLELQKANNVCNQMKLETALVFMDTMKRWAIIRTLDGKTSNWLTVVLIAHHHLTFPC